MKKIGLTFISLFILLCAVAYSENPTDNRKETTENISPFDIECIVQPVYGYRKDKKPGREVILHFKGGKIFSKYRIEVDVAGIKETIKPEPSIEGDSTCIILLPTGVGVDKSEKVNIKLRHNKDVLSKTFDVPRMRYWNVYLYNHSHVDIGYSNTQENVEILHKNNIREGIKLSKETNHFSSGSRFTWNPEIIWPVERLWNSDPDEREKILEAIRNEWLSLDASYLHLNTSTCSDEELFHLFNFSRMLQNMTGKTIDVMQQIDIPGMSWGLIPVMNQLGVKYIMSWPNSDRAGHAHEGLDMQPFWWEGQDGKSKVLFFQPGNYTNSGSAKKGAETGRPWFGQRDLSKIPSIIKTGHAQVDFTDRLVQMEQADYPYDFLVLSWSLWDNSTIDVDVAGAVKEWNDRRAYPHIIISGSHEIMEMIETKYGDQLPVKRGDFTEYWTDGLGTSAKYTAVNRNAKELLNQTETLWTMLHPGEDMSRKEFNEAWRYVSLSSEHTWGFENPNEPYFHEAIWKEKQQYFIEADDRTQNLYNYALAPATDKSNGALGPPEGASNGGIAVFNTHSWMHDGLITLKTSESYPGNRVIDENGQEVPSQRLSTGELVFLATGVPGFGSRHYRVVAGESSFTSDSKIEENILENRFLQLTIDPETGNISQLIQKSTGYNFADVKIHGGLNAFIWIPANVDTPESDTEIKINIVESGPLVNEIKISSQARGCRFVSRSVRLVEGQSWVEITNVVDKLPMVEKDGIHFGFGFNIPESRTKVDIPWGIMQIEKDQLPQANRNWFALQRWLDVSNDRVGVTWCSLDAPLFEYGQLSANISLSWGGQGPWIKKLENSSTIYSWVMNNHWHTNFPLTQDGPVIFRYRIHPHGTYNPTQSNRFGLEQSQPLRHLAANNNPGLTPLVAVDNEMVYITILKSNGPDEPTVIRLRSLSDVEETVNLSFPAGTPEYIKAFETSGLTGKEITPYLKLDPFGTKSVYVKFTK